MEIETKKIKTEMFFRAMDAVATEPESDPNCIKYRISSPEPYKRVFMTERGQFEEGMEILEHSKNCIDMTRLMSKAPFLNQHNPDEQIGVIENAEIKENDGIYVNVRFSENPKPQEILRDVKSGIRTKCSIGYMVKSFKREPAKDSNSLPIYRAVDWLPYEASSVSIPADITAETVRAEKVEFETDVMSERKIELEASKEPEAITKSETVITVKENKKDTKMDKKFIDEIVALGKGHGAEKEALEFIAAEKSVEEFKSMLLEKKPAPVAANMELGLDKKEIKKYSLMNLVNALASNDMRDAGFEMELSREIEKRSGKAPRSAYVPFDVFKQRDLTVSPTSAGGFAVQTDVLADSFIDALRPNTVCLQAGATVLNGLKGNVLIPRLATAAVAAWVAENVAPSITNQVFEGPTLSPKTLAAWCSIGRTLRIQSSVDVESLVRNDLLRQFAIAIDAAALVGSGASNQPTGIVKMTHPLASQMQWSATSTPAFLDVIAMETIVTAHDAMIGNKGAYIFNPTYVGKAKGQPKASNNSGFVLEDGKVNGYPVFSTSQLSSTYAQTAIFGDFSQLLLGLWSNGGVDILVDPYTYSGSGALKISALMTADVQVRHEESFALCSDGTLS